MIRVSTFWSRSQLGITGGHRRAQHVMMPQPRSWGCRCRTGCTFSSTGGKQASRSGHNSIYERPCMTNTGLPCGSDGKESACMQMTWVPSLNHEDPPEEVNGYPPQYSCLENPMDKGACQASQGVTQLSN